MKTKVIEMLHRENRVLDGNENEQVADTMRKNIDARTRDGVARSSDETLVMRAERRDSVIHTVDERRQPVMRG